MSRFIQCPDCHGVALVIYGEGEAGCGTYDKLHVNTTDAALEKHLPVVKVKKDCVEAKVGENDHPMETDHYITWVYLETTRGGQLRTLKPGDKPAVQFLLSDDERPLAVYEYCNKHGLWKSEIAQQ
ncbi:MAG: desulfoferrodoxin [Lachnospiraceae bacterium]|jgi:superoxide reductase|nr:desulfoferrodoxin [Lachnospiraceae bacterium]NBJ81762.1 desulfoferrodoxin [bacterium 1XD42-76]NBK05206.1 desulfoferrodoxin [bacterium 1XD42-94]